MPGAPVCVLGLIDVRGDVVAVIDPADRFGDPVREPAMHDHLLIVNGARRKMALLANEVHGVVAPEPTDVSDAGNWLPGAGCVSGTLRGAEGLVLIHNLDAFLSLEEEDSLERALEARQNA
ncbi:hypothetical protein GCM10011289_27400 [Paludibacterium paludis]|uniref:CheW-like domain-containing protein n=1 Tax=Paludibacterium paludis TaxID=1225769 RepID=A0A918P594_9NEIS|nr:hypothetical protein GCM10011289_27400 [Paludibacterium paludis]